MGVPRRQPDHLAPAPSRPCCCRSSPRCAATSRRRASSAPSSSRSSRRGWRAHGPRSVTDRVVHRHREPGHPAAAVARRPTCILERNNLALEVTDQHPRLQALDDRLREVRREMRREVAAQIALLRNREEILNRQIGELLPAQPRGAGGRAGPPAPAARRQGPTTTSLTLLKTQAPGSADQGVGGHRGGHDRPAGHRAGRAASAARRSTRCWSAPLLGLDARPRARLRAGDARHLDRHHRGRRDLPRGPGARHRAAHRPAGDDAAAHRATAGARPDRSRRARRATRSSSRTSIRSRRWPRPTARCARTSSSRGWSAAARSWWSPARRCRKARRPPSSTSRSPWPRTARRRCWSARNLRRPEHPPLLRHRARARPVATSSSATRSGATASAPSPTS